MEKQTANTLLMMLILKNMEEACKKDIAASKEFIEKCK